MTMPLEALKRSCDHGEVSVMLAPGQACPLCAMRSSQRRRNIAAVLGRRSSVERARRTSARSSMLP